MGAPFFFDSPEARGWNQRAAKSFCPRCRWQGLNMNHPNPNVVVEARRLARAPGWYVRIAWPNFKHEHIPGFVTQDEALRWIEQNAQAWLSEHGISPSLIGHAAVPGLGSRAACSVS